MSKFRLEGDLMGSLEGFQAKAEDAMFVGAKYVADEAKAYMRTNAIWTDRTGNARSGLSAHVYMSKGSGAASRHGSGKSGARVAIVLFHRVPYGPWLEVRWGGKYGIIDKTIQYGAPRLLEVVGRLLF